MSKVLRNASFGAFCNTFDMQKLVLKTFLIFFWGGHLRPVLLYADMISISEGESRKEKDQELKIVMKKLEAKYAALQVVPVIDKLGNPKV